MANFNFKTTADYEQTNINSIVFDAKRDFANYHAADSELLFRVVAIGRDEDNDTTDYFDILEEEEMRYETVWQMVQHAVANFTVLDDVDTDTETIEIVLEACYLNADEGVNCFDDIVVATANIQRRSRKEIIDDILTCFENDLDMFAEIIEDADDYDGFLEDDRWYSMDDLEDVLSGKDIIEILNMGKFGEDLEEWNFDSHGNKEYSSFNPNRDYFKFNGYGNLVSSNWRDYSNKIDRYAVEEIEENRGHITSIDDYDDVVALFSELDEASC